MAEGNTNMEPFTTDQIRLYIEGKLSPADAHAIELAALSDPFLADAIEGMEIALQKNATAYDEDISELRARVQDSFSTQRKSPVKFMWRSAAAVALVLIIGVVVTWSLIKKEPTKEIARVEEIHHPADAASSRMDTTTITNSIKPADAVNPKKNQANATVQPKKNILEPSYPQMRKDEIEPVEQPKAFSPRTEDSAPQRLSDDTIARMLSGKVAGVTTRGEAARKSAAADSQLQEVVVAGYGNNKRGQPSLPSALQNASISRKNFEPYGGWDAFDHYVDSTKRIFAPDISVSGDEIISFHIGSSGEPQDFSIEKSLSAVHDSASISLVKAGPAWKVVKGHKRKVRLAIAY